LGLIEKTFRRIEGNDAGQKASTAMGMGVTGIQSFTHSCRLLMRKRSRPSMKAGMEILLPNPAAAITVKAVPAMGAGHAWFRIKTYDKETARGFGFEGPGHGPPQVVP
jgi:hypothetical protein